MTSVIVSREYKTVIVTESDGKTAAISAPNPAIIVETVGVGPQGPPGPAGTGYVHQQLTVSSVWTINHNLGYKPAVELLDSGSQEIDGDISHPSINQTVVTLNPATAGIARLT